MASAVSRDASQLEFLGDEWSDDASLTQCMEEFILPYIGVNRLSHSVCCESASLAAGCISHLPPSGLLSVGGSPIDSSLMTVAEIGVGGGRVATRVYKHVKHLYCLDIAEEMIQQAKESIAHAHTRQQQAIDKPSTDNESIASPSSTEPTLPSNISFHLLSSAPQFPPRLLGTCDFVYSFDVMPHIDLHTIYAYMKTIKGLLRPNPTGAEVSSRPRPRVFLHTANLCAPLGFDRFSKQTRPTAGGFHFLSPEMIRTLAKQCGYRIIQESRCNTDQMKQGEAGEETAEDNAFKAQQAQRAKNIYYQVSGVTTLACLLRVYIG